MIITNIRPLIIGRESKEDLLSPKVRFFFIVVTIVTSLRALLSLPMVRGFLL